MTYNLRTVHTQRSPHSTRQQLGQEVRIQREVEFLVIPKGIRFRACARA
jgi:hypothetical protein